MTDTRANAQSDGLASAAAEVGAAAVAQLRRVPDESVRQRATEVVAQAMAALTALRRVHLPQDHIEVGQSPEEEERYRDLAPYVFSALAAINALLAHVTSSFPAPPEPAEDEFSEDDFDFDFDLTDAAPDSGAPAADPKANFTPEERVAEAAHAYAGMLRSRVLEFGERLANTLEQEDTWPMLAELDEGQHRLTKAVQGLLFGVLSVYGPDFRREEVLPEYRSAQSESISLRTGVVELSYHIAKFNQALADADSDIAIPLVVGVADRLSRFSARPEYRTLRADDKKAIIDFRRALYRLRHAKGGLSMSSLRLAVEGFSKFLESLQAINHREVLVLHDRQKLEVLLVDMDVIVAQVDSDPHGAMIALGALVEDLEVVVGRNPELDERRREYRRLPPGPEQAAVLVPQWRALLQATLGMVG